MTASGPFIVTHRQPRVRERCDETTVLNTRCRRPATVGILSGSLAGDCYCTSHAKRAGAHRAETQALEATRVLYREAFATLEEARDAAEQRVRDAVNTLRDSKGKLYPALTFSPLVLAATEAPESGCTISLPDGSVIEVEAVRYDKLWQALSPEFLPRLGVRPSGREQRDATLAAWNAEHGSGLDDDEPEFDGPSCERCGVQPAATCECDAEHGIGIEKDPAMQRYAVGVTYLIEARSSDEAMDIAANAFTSDPRFQHASGAYIVEGVDVETLAAPVVSYGDDWSGERPPELERADGLDARA